ncbi:low affinity immunoglobulin gamma Fc region receptor II-a-like isoform X5 [Scomber scombrus]
MLWIAVSMLIVSFVLLVLGFLCIWRHSGTESGSGDDNQIVCGDDTADDPSSVTYAVVVTKKRQDEDTAGAAAENLSLDTNHGRNSQTQKDEDESSLQPVNSALNVDDAPPPLQTESGLSSSTVALNPTDPSPTEQEEIVYSPIKIIKHRDT